jgi:hypothetical protein
MSFKIISETNANNIQPFESLLTDLNYVPLQFQDKFTIPNLPLHVHAEGPYFKDHLQLMFNHLTNADQLPDKYGKYKQILCDPNNRKFFQYFIIWHDMGKITTEVRTIIEEGNELSLYHEHEKTSYKLFIQNLNIAGELTNREVLAEVIKLHGELYKISQEPITKEAFAKFISENNIDKNKIQEIIPLLIAADILDVLGTIRPDPWNDRPLYFAKGYEDYTTQ